MSVWPNLFLSGAPKCGSSQLHRLLSMHPDIYFPPQKELHFFSRLDASDQRHYSIPVVSDERRYSALYRSHQEKWLGDASPSYLWSKEAHRRIARKVPSARIIVVLREPVERAVSHYWNAVREGFEERPVAKALAADLMRPQETPYYRAYIACSSYRDQCVRVEHYFAGKQLLAINFADLAADPLGTAQRIAEYLELDGMPGMRPPRRAENRRGVPRSPFVAKLLGSPSARRIAGGVIPRPIRRLLRSRILFRDVTSEPLPEDLRRNLESHFAPTYEYARTRFGIVWPKDDG